MMYKIPHFNKELCKKQFTNKNILKKFLILFFYLLQVIRLVASQLCERMCVCVCVCVYVLPRLGLGIASVTTSPKSRHPQIPYQLTHTHTHK